MTTNTDPHTRAYTTRNGVQQFKPSIQLCMALNSESRGFCLACGDTDTPHVEPDARRYTCTNCGARKVYGAEELVAMGLTFDADRK